jgi:hypothetical protein
MKIIHEEPGHDLPMSDLVNGRTASSYWHRFYEDGSTDICVRWTDDSLSIEAPEPSWHVEVLVHLTFDELRTLATCYNIQPHSWLMDEIWKARSRMYDERRWDKQAAAVEGHIGSGAYFQIGRMENGDIILGEKRDPTEQVMIDKDGKVYKGFQYWFGRMAHAVSKSSAL